MSKHARIRQMVLDGASSNAIRKALRVRHAYVSSVRTKMAAERLVARARPARTDDALPVETDAQASTFARLLRRVAPFGYAGTNSLVSLHARRRPFRALRETHLDRGTALA